MSFVLDCSATLAFILPDEGGIDPGLTGRLLAEGALVPSLWTLEVANCLLMAERRGRIAPEFRNAALADLALLPISQDGETARSAWGRTSDLAKAHHLTLYDATYLELALRLGLPLASLDRDLVGAAGAAGVPVLRVR
ncbi:type II toxin-antitoxin system VapC family toxin [Niveispirillum sp. KHB5.9]|uniref:type II toxin-antitoxin system VapC family toxin n=1 Tax=Niveispirillum sp. KHB5.9 TaxID=3400269 RepID=UPI003A856F52